MTNSVDTSSDNKFVSEVRSNVKSDLIEITEDKLENILLKHLKKVTTTKNWITPLSIFITVLIVLLTAEFKEFLDLEKEVWKAIFIIILICSFIYLIITIIRAIIHSNKSSITYLIEEIKYSESTKSLKPKRLIEFKSLRLNELKSALLKSANKYKKDQ